MNNREENIQLIHSKQNLARYLWISIRLLCVVTDRVNLQKWSNFLPIDII